MKLVRLSALTAIVTILLAALLLPVPATASGGTRLMIASADIDQPVVSVPLRSYPDGVVTWDVSQIGSRVAHYEGTAWFGEGGNIVMGVHSELGAERQASTGALLYDVALGDEILVTSGNSELRYTVSDIRVVAFDDVSVLMPTSGEQITIMTCHIPSYDNGFYSERLIVIAIRTN